MRIQLIRGATLRFSYAGRNFIIDPCFSAKHTMPSWAGKSLNPLVDLGCSPLEVIEGIECNVVKDVIKRTQPKIIVTHSCGAVWRNSTPIVMDATQTINLCHSAPKSTVIATHMDSFDHATVSREFLREYANANNVSPENLLIPNDMEQYTFD
jgi:hypothetical protein